MQRKEKRNMGRERKTCLVLALSLLSLVAFSEAFDSFWMIYQWPPSVCNRKGRTEPCTGPVPHMFTINGLWPRSNSGPQKINCNPRNRFDPTKTLTIEADLNTFWPDVEGGDDRRLWSQQWSRHGTCSDPPFNQLQYFQQALDNRLNHEYDLQGILHNAQINPTGRSPYSTDQIKLVIAKAIGKNPIVRCNTNAEFDVKQLVDITLCFSADGVTLVDCPLGKDQCPPSFVWLPHNYTNIAMVTDLQY